MRKFFLSGVSTLALVAISSHGSLVQAADPITEASAVIEHGDISGNEVVDYSSIRRNDIIDSAFSGSDGALTVQQNTGNANRMLTAVGINADTDDVVDHFSTTTVEVESQNNEVVHWPSASNPLDRGNLIGSNAVAQGFADYQGILSVQQNNGDANDLGIATTAQGGVSNIGEIDQTAMTKGDTHGNMGNGAIFIGTDFIGGMLLDTSNRENAIEEGAFNGAGGILTIQQNNGNANAMSVATSVIGVLGNTGKVKQTARVEEAKVEGNWALTVDATRDNSIVGAFNNEAAGVMTVQQNNADGNLMTVATAVLGTANLGLGLGLGDTNSQVSGAEGTDAVIEVTDGVTKDEFSQRENLIGSLDDDIDPLTDETGSFNSVSGTITVQQNNGSHNVLAVSNAVASVLGDAGDMIQTAHLGAEVNDPYSVDFIAVRDNRLNDSFEHMRGLATVQQNNGDSNAMAVANAVLGGTGNAGAIIQKAGSLDDGVVQGDLFEGLTEDTLSYRTNYLGETFKKARGLATVQQNNGNGNVITAANAVASVMGWAGNVSQTVEAGGTVLDFQATDFVSARYNTLDHAFEAASGAMTAQQNNGNGNVLDAATGVIGTMGYATSVSQHVTASGSLAEYDPSTGALTTWLDVWDEGSARANVLDEAFGESSGQATVQQNNGDVNVMSAATAVAVNSGVAGRTEEFNQTVSADGVVEGSVTTLLDRDRLSLLGASRENWVGNSFNGANGVATIQQNNGSSNVMSAATGVAVDLSQGTAGAESPPVERVQSQYATASGKVHGNTSNLVHIGGVNLPTNTMSDSFNESGGVSTVQQNNGDNNVLSAATAVVASLGTDDIDEVVDQAASASASVKDNRSNLDAGFVSDRWNDIYESFNGAKGVATIQQNNGNNNVLASAVAVVASLNATNKADGAAKSSAVGGELTSENNWIAVPVGSVSYNGLANSFDDFQGVASVIQNNGDANALGSSIAVTGHNMGLGAAVSMAALSGSVSGASVTVGLGGSGAAPSLSNEITGSFQGAHGVVSVIQNNGHHNVIGSAISVSVGFSN